MSSEISLAQSGAASLPSSCETQMVDVYREKPIRLVVKVTVPVKEHPKVRKPKIPPVGTNNEWQTNRTTILCLHKDFVIALWHDASNCLIQK